MRAAGERERRAHNARALLAWNIYALPLSKPQKKFSDLTIEPEKPKRPERQTAEQQIAAFKSMMKRR